MATARPNNRLRHSAIGASDSAGTRRPQGRPKCDTRMTAAPRANKCSTVGRAARIRVSSTIRPASSSGTLKSTRTSTRLPATSRFLMVRLAMGLTEEYRG